MSYVLLFACACDVVRVRVMCIIMLFVLLFVCSLDCIRACF